MMTLKQADRFARSRTPCSGFVRFAILALLLSFLAGCQPGDTREDISSAERPNILIAISDDHSYPHTSAYGYPAIKTPAFDRVASQGLLFENAFVASPGCSPSRAAFLTGRQPWQLEEAGTHASSFPAHYVVYPDLLEQNGYFVGYTGKGWGPGNWEISGRTRNPAGEAFNDHLFDEAPARGINRNDYTANFEAFLDSREPGQPFHFWFGASEPHRPFEEGIGVRTGKELETVVVPAFLPDTPVVRSDLLDYAYEIEWFDRHLGQMLEILEARGELENTLVIVTGDNGMAFPRAKANLYAYGIHVPLAIQWPARISPGRTVSDLVSLVDLAPTILEITGIEHTEQFPMTGRSMTTILSSQREGLVDPSRNRIYSGRERHSSSRYENMGYPARALRTEEYLYIRNFAPERWPAGDPQKFEEDGELGPMHGAYHDIDAAPSLTLLVEGSGDPELSRFLELAVAKRPAEELYLIAEDPECLRNLADSDEHEEILRQLRQQLERYLVETGDPRMGPNADVFETYPRYSPIRSFPPPADLH